MWSRLGFMSCTYQFTNQCHESGMAKTTGLFFPFVAVMAMRADAHYKQSRMGEGDCPGLG